MNGSVPVHIVGNVVAAPELRFTPSGAAVCSIRIASTERYRDKDGEWKDGKTVFLSINCWRQLAENVAESINTGDRVVVVGKLASREFDGRDGNKRTVLEVEADDVGASMARSPVTIRKGERGGQPAQGDAFGDDPWATAPVGAGVGSSEPVF